MKNEFKGKYFSSFFALITCHPLAWLGSFLVTLSSSFALLYTVYTYTRGDENLYLSLLFIILAPSLFFTGLGLIPAGVFLRLRKIRRDEKTESLKAAALLVSNRFGSEKVRSVVAVIVVLTVINLALAGFIVTETVEYAESVSFCGEVCHTVMAPEYTAYQHSSHAKVPCVKCHVGPGAVWFVKAKLNGARQLVSLATNSYSKPIPVPIAHLRPAREICENCHWPEKFRDEKLKVIPHFEPDESNTLKHTVLLLKVGGTRGIGIAEGKGVHWHVSKSNRVFFPISESYRDRIDKVRWIKPNGEVSDYFYSGLSESERKFDAEDLHEMDCLDCHNRPSHKFDIPEEAVNELLYRVEEYRSIPFLKKAAMEVIQMPYTEKEIQSEVPAKRLMAWYQKENLLQKEDQKVLLEKAGQDIGQIVRKNIWPDMKITWQTYPDLSSHIHFAGCLRCHNNTLEAEDGHTINADCRICHEVVALKEKNPNVLERLRQK